MRAVDELLAQSDHGGTRLREFLFDLCTQRALVVTKLCECGGVTRLEHSGFGTLCRRATDQPTDHEAEQQTGYEDHNQFHVASVTTGADTIR